MHGHSFDACAYSRKRGDRRREEEDHLEIERFGIHHPSHWETSLPRGEGTVSGFHAQSRDIKRDKGALLCIVNLHVLGLCLLVVSLVSK